MLNFSPFWQACQNKQFSIDLWSKRPAKQGVKNHKKGIKLPKKTEALRVRLTSEENESFKKIADNIGEKRSNIIRKIIREIINNDIDLLSDEKLLIKTALRQLVGLSNNFNQLIAAIHSKSIKETVNINHINDINKGIKSFKTELQNHIKKNQHRWIKSL